MKSYRTRRYYQALRLERGLVLYTGLILICMVAVLAMMLPFVKQRIPTEDITMLKTSLATLPPITITVGANGQYVFNTGAQCEPPMSLKRLRNTLLKHLQVLDLNKVPICISTEPAVSYEQIVELIVLLQSLGLEYIGLIAPSNQT